MPSIKLSKKTENVREIYFDRSMAQDVAKPMKKK